MKKPTKLDLLLLLLTGLLAGYHIVVGVEGKPMPVMVCHTIAFGVMLVGVIMLIILGFGALEGPLVVIIFTIIPLSLSLGLVCEYLPDWKPAYRWFVLGGGTAVALSRYLSSTKTTTLAITLVHGLAGLIITLLPIALVLNKSAPSGFILVSLGGAVMSAGGLLFSAWKIGRPILVNTSIPKLLPAILLIMTTAFIAGFGLA
jgi:hypothetical protein